MSERILVTETGGSAGAVGVLLLPPFFAPLYLIYSACEQMSRKGVHPFFVLVFAAATVALIAYAAMQFYRTAAPKFAGGVTGLYAGAVYGWIVALFTADPVWIFGTAMLSGAMAFWIGTVLAKEAQANQ
jgi:hypothetical protein